MRTGLHPPRETIAAEELHRIRSYLDGQSRIDLAVWVMHEHQGAEGPLFDHHLMLGIPDDDYETGDPGALELGIELPQPGWLDVFPLSEVEELRTFGTVVWERGDQPRTGDPLDFRLGWEPLEVEPDVADAFTKLVRSVDNVLRIDGTLERLSKNGAEIRQMRLLYVDFEDRRPDDFDRVKSAAREAGLGVTGMSAGLPANPEIRTSRLYEVHR
jgi:hypothetical protein